MLCQNDTTCKQYNKSILEFQKKTHHYLGASIQRYHTLNANIVTLSRFFKEFPTFWLNEKNMNPRRLHARRAARPRGATKENAMIVSGRCMDLLLTKVSHLPLYCPIYHSNAWTMSRNELFQSRHPVIYKCASINIAHTCRGISLIFRLDIHTN